ncbi:MAG: S8 family serine peptidase [Saprospiraceae bacterium]|nr:S8 family serine peptidase [Saprospiraceae bacterium]
MRSYLSFAVFTIFAAALFSACTNSNVSDVLDETTLVTPQSDEGAIIEGQYILIFKEDKIAPAITYLTQPIRNRSEKSALMAEYGKQVENQINAWLAKEGISQDAVLAYYTAVQSGVAVRLSDEAFERVKKSDALGLVEYDRVVELPPFTVEEVVQDAGRAQTTPCGITNAGGAAAAGTDRWIWIIDSGIDTDHPDLSVVTNTAYAVSFVPGSSSFEDCNGHGTHVAGTAAALNNTIGVIGVASGAPVVPVRVFPCSGGSATSTILSGVNHVAANDLAGDVVNMSLGGYYGTSGCSTGSSYRTALQAMGNAGTRIALASGNNYANAAHYQPACVNGTNIFTVTNMRCNKTYYNDPTYGGNYNTSSSGPVDWIATGTSVYSTYLNGGYATLTGTSMATPHVAGIMQIRNAAPVQSGSVTNAGQTYKIAVR